MCHHWFQVQVRFSDDKGLASDDKARICKDLKSFMAPIQEKMRVFEEELKGSSENRQC